MKQNIEFVGIKLQKNEKMMGRGCNATIVPVRAVGAKGGLGAVEAITAVVPITAVRAKEA